jgi:hypothetical protein
MTGADALARAEGIMKRLLSHVLFCVARCVGRDGHGPVLGHTDKPQGSGASSGVFSRANDGVQSLVPRID